MADGPNGARHHSFTVEPAAVDRLDVLIARRLEISRTLAATLIANGHVTVDGKRERASFRAEPGGVVEVEVPPPPGRDIVPESIPVNVVFEDEHLLVIDKPPNMVVHPAPGHWSGTLVNALLGRGSELAPGATPDRAGLVHRLDKDTSGLLIVAKTEHALQRMSADLAARRVQRRYAALCWGHLRTDRQRVDAPVARDPRDRRRMAVVDAGRAAITDLVRIARFDATDLLRVHLLTGRTHQIRVHLAHLHRPVVGDVTYGGARRQLAGIEKGRHFLHAAWLRFRHPVTEAICDLRSELPADLVVALASAADDSSLIERPQPLDYLGFFHDDG